jgi:xanthine dehydrogenase molybdopterin binding subunit
LNLPHESAEFHVSGEALFVDDIPAPEQLLQGYVVYSPYEHARIRSFDLTKARSLPGVAAVLSYRDIPGHNQMGPVIKDELCLAEEEVTFVGQAVFLIAAETLDRCREAAAKIIVDYEQLPSILTIEDAIRTNSLLGPPRTMRRGDPDAALSASPHVLNGELRTGAQEHWYLETQACLCIPGEGDDMFVNSSTQHPSETQALITEVLGRQRNEIVVEVKRIGGGFGGKETQANHTACWTALLSNATKRPVKIRLFRDDDMIMTGKRHRFLIKYSVGFDDDGMLQAVKFEFNSDGGAASDLSFAIMERAMLHADNAYYVPHMEVLGRVWKTNLPSNTAFRGFGGPQGMAAIETIIDRVARYLTKDPVELRHKNFYQSDVRNVTHYGQMVENNHLQEIFNKLIESSEYQKRRKEVEEFNDRHEFLKKGIALTPVKFGISFTTTFLNQAGALVNVYMDGSVLVNHGGTEMGQGLHTKIQAIAAQELGISPENVKVNATNTSKVPNTSPTAASTGADMNGMAVKYAIDTIKQRIATEMVNVFALKFKGEPTLAEHIVFEKNCVGDAKHPDRSMSFKDTMIEMNLRRVSLSATGYYSTPEIGWDKQKGWGRPFFYYVYSMAVTEVLVDILTGKHEILRADILHECANSINQMIDRGQIEGGYVQGVGWCTTEEIKWDDRGRLLTHSPDTYKIPTSCDIPRDFRVAMLEGLPNPQVVQSSKAVGEPPFMLALSAWLAIKDAISAVADHSAEPDFALPATNELIVLSAHKLRLSV